MRSVNADFLPEEVDHISERGNAWCRDKFLVSLPEWYINPKDFPFE
jgi:hypothetical protein